MDVEFDAQSMASGSGGSMMSFGSSMNGTPAPSIYSFNSSRDGSSLLREVDGRIFNAQNDLYLLPADEGEFGRLDKQHLVMTLAVGGLYEAAHLVRAALAPDPDYQKTILDLGTGGGNWAIAMAMEFPHAQVVGVDLAPATTRPPPPNCRFEFDDFTRGLEHYYGAFDVIHARATANGVADYAAVVCEATRCLRPGGVLLLVDGNFEILNEHKEPQERAYGDGQPGGSWFARMCYEAYNFMKLRGSNVDAGIMLERWMRETPGLEAIGGTSHFIPIGPWDRSGANYEERHRKQVIGTLFRQDVKEFSRSLQPMFLAGGYAPELVDRFVHGSDEELDNLSVHMFLQFHYAWGRKQQTELFAESECTCFTNPPLPGHDMPSRESGQIFLRTEDAEVIQEAQRSVRIQPR